jgi:transcription initiation factor TFIIB
MDLRPLNLKLCPNCNKPSDIITDTESGETICGNCGMILTDKSQETRAEWNAFNAEDINAKSRTGSPLSLAKHDKGLSTIIGKINKDASGQQIDTAMHKTVGRWRMLDSRSQYYGSANRNLNIAFSKLQGIKNQLTLPDYAVEKTAYIYRKILEKGIVKGRSIDAAVVVASYIACKEMEIPRTLKEIAKLVNIKEKAAFSIYKKVIVELDIKVPLADPVRNIVTVANRCKISEKTRRHAIKVMDEIIKRRISASKNPMGLAGAVLYLSCKYHDEEITQKDIAEAAGVTEVTIRNRLSNLKSLNVL